MQSNNDLIDSDLSYFMFFKSKNKSLNTEEKNKQSFLESLQIAKKKQESLKKCKNKN
jgi:hypothetical protein